jgi:hypothetical protein
MSRPKCVAFEWKDTVVLDWPFNVVLNKYITGGSVFILIIIIYRIIEPGVQKAYTLNKIEDLCFS